MLQNNGTLKLHQNLTQSLAMAGDAEKHLIVSLVQARNGPVLQETRLFLKCDQFSGEVWREAYRAILGLSDAGKGYDWEFLIPIIADACKMDESDVFRIVTDAINDCFIAASSPPQEYARSVVRQWQHVESRRLALRFVESLSSPRSAIEDVIDEMSKEIIRVRDGFVDSSADEFSMRATVEEFVNQPPLVAIPTGLGPLDDGTQHGGFCRQQLVVIGARPSVGKSSLCGQIALNMAQHGFPTMYLMNEMTKPEMTARWLTQSQMILSNEMDRHHFEGFPLMPVECAGWTIDRMELEARMAVAKHGLAVIVLDQLGPLAGSHPHMKTLDRITDNTRRLKIMAATLNIVVIVAHQFNRTKEGRDTSRPKMSDFRDSGSVEQDADILIGLHRDLTPGEQHEAVLYIMKQRSGETSDIRMDFSGDRTMFMEKVLPAEF